MRRVYTIWALRKLLHPVTLKSALLVLLAWKSTEYVSYVNVFSNLPSVFDVSHHISFARSAIAETEVTTLLLLPLIVTFLAWLIVDIVRKKEAFI